MEHTKSHTSPLPHGEGYLLFVGYLQLVAGALTIAFSGLAIVLAMLAGDGTWMNPVAVARSFGSPEAGFFVKLIATYAALQVTFGWIFGLLMVVSGILCIKSKGRRFVTATAIINLFNFPHGTTVGLLVIHGMTRPGISAAFDKD